MNHGAVSAGHSGWAAGHIGWAATMACLLEAGAEKPGNVTPTRCFRDTTYTDFLLSSVAIGPVLARAADLPVGRLVLAAVQATRAVTRVNTNLGVVLLLAPLARAYARHDPAGAAADPADRAIPPGRADPAERADRASLAVSATPPGRWALAALRRAVAAELAALTVADARDTYTAIRLANPGGLGQVADHDVAGEPDVSLRAAMVAAADRDGVAAEYASDYQRVFTAGVPALLAALDSGLEARAATVQVYLTLLAGAPDTLVARKLGAKVAAAVSDRARQVLTAGGLQTPAGRRALRSLDRYLRDPANRRNPGTTADLVAAAWFATLLVFGPRLLRRCGGAGSA